MAEEREFGVAADFDFPLVVFGNTNFSTSPTFAAGDIRLSKDGATWVNINSTSIASQIGINSGVFTLNLDSTEMQFARGVLAIIDQTTTKIWEDQAILIGTYGDTASLHAFNRNSTSPNVNAAAIGVGVIGSTQFAAGAINSTAIAAGAITAAKFAANAISSGVVSTGQMELAAAAVWDRVLTNALHNIVQSAGRRLRQLQEAGGYSLGAVYVDTINGSTGTSNFEDGVETNPVAPIADANTIAASVGLSRFFIAPGSDITFAASQVNQEFVGENWELALGGQIISGSHIQGAHVTGIGTSTDEIHFDHCEMDLCTIGVAHVDECDISGTVILSDAAEYFFIQCNHGGTTSIIDFSTGAGNQTVHVHRYNGQLTIENLGVAGIDVLHFDGAGANLTLSTSCVGGTVNLNGVFVFTNNGSTTIVLNRAGDNISLLPTALVGGRMDADVGAMQAGVIGSTQFAAGAINSTAIAADALSTGNIADGVFTKIDAGTNTQVLDVMTVDTFGEPINTTNLPPVAETLANKLGWHYGAFRNRGEQSTSLKSFFTSTGGLGFTKAISDTGTYIEQVASS